MQADRPRIVLPEHDPVDIALGRQAQREQVDVAVACAGVEVRVEHRSQLRAQLRSERALLGGLRRVG